MLADLLPIAPPVGRVDRLFLDFGRTELGTPLRQSLLAYNAGGGRLQGVVEVDADWLHLSWPGAPPAARRPFDNDRQPVTITALPERVPRHGTPTEAEVRFIFPSGLTRVRCSIERPALPASIRVTPTCLRIRPHPLGRSVAGLTFRNEGEVAAIIALHASPPNGIRIEPAELELEAGAEGTVLAIWHPVSSQAEHLREWLHAGRHSLEGRTPPVAPGASVPPVEYLLEWLIDGLPGGFIPVEVVTIGSLARSVLNRFRRPDAGDELRVSRQSCRDEQ
jgi:hypothetical protein